MILSSPLYSNRGPSHCQGVIHLLCSYLLTYAPLSLQLTIKSAVGNAWSTHSWFAPYLSGHSYQVFWRGSLYRLCTLITGILQGSKLGSMLYTLYTEFLCTAISSHSFYYHCHAVGTQLYLSTCMSCSADIAATTCSCRLAL